MLCAALLFSLSPVVSEIEEEVQTEHGSASVHIRRLAVILLLRGNRPAGPPENEENCKFWVICVSTTEDMNEYAEDIYQCAL